MEKEVSEMLKEISKEFGSLKVDSVSTLPNGVLVVKVTITYPKKEKK
jgi:hypothetical protein